MNTTGEIYGKRVRIRLDGESLIVAESRAKARGESLSEYIRSVLRTPVPMGEILRTPMSLSDTPADVRTRIKERLRSAQEVDDDA